MKNLIFIFILGVVMTVSSCGNKTENNTEQLNDSIEAVDSVVSDSLIDSVMIDSACIDTSIYNNIQ